MSNELDANTCMCGCGTETKGVWKAGHDKTATDAVLRLVTGCSDISTLARENPALLRAAMGRGR